MTLRMKIRSSPLMAGKYYTMLLGGTLSTAMLSIVLISDSIISGIILGSDAVVGVTLVTPLCSVSSFLGSLVSLGIPILYNSEMGRFQKEDADRVFGMGTAVSIGMGVLLFLILSLFGDDYFLLYHPSRAALEQASLYLHWMRFSMLLLPVQMLMAGMVYADGDEKVSTVANVTQSLGNVAASLILSRFMGVSGVSLGSFLFYAISLGILSIHFLKKSNSLHFRLFFSPKILRRMLRYSLIYSSEYLFNGLLLAALSAFISAHMGEEYLIMVSLVNMCRVIQFIPEGIGTAISPIVTVYLGEKCFPGVRKIYDRARKTNFWECLGITAILLMLAPMTPLLLGITDMELATLVIRGLCILSVTSLSVGRLYLLTAYYMVTDKTLLGFTIGVIRDFILAVPLAIVMSVWLGIYGFFIGLALTPFVTFLMVVVYLRIRYGEDIPLLLAGSETDGETYTYDLVASPSEITHNRDLIGAELEKHGYSSKTVNRAILLFEEMFMLIHEKNPGINVRGECVLRLEGEVIRMIIRDTGILFDPTNTDMEVSSLESYVISTVAEQVSSGKNHLVTMSFNRNVFELRDEP